MLGNRMFETVLVNQLCKRYVLCHRDNTNVFYTVGFSTSSLPTLHKRDHES